MGNYVVTLLCWNTNFIPEANNLISHNSSTVSYVVYAENKKLAELLSLKATDFLLVLHIQGLRAKVLFYF